MPFHPERSVAIAQLISHTGQCVWYTRYRQSVHSHEITQHYYIATSLTYSDCTVMWSVTLERVIHTTYGDLFVVDVSRRRALVTT